MIQRRQSIWLAIAAVLNAATIFLNLYSWHTAGSQAIGSLRVVDHLLSLVLVLAMAIVPVVAIFRYKNRKQQIRLCLIDLLGVFLFVAILHWRVRGLDALVPPPVNCSYQVGALLPIASVVFLVMAILAIRKDDKLVKSMDRLR